MSPNWIELFAELQRLEGLDARTATFRELCDRLATQATDRERDARKRKDKGDLFRARIVRASVQRISGGSVVRVGEPGIAIEWLPGEAWLTTRVLVPGNTRTETLLAALVERDVRDADARLAFAAGCTDEEASLFHIDLAQRIAKAVDERAPSARSALRLARLYRLGGAHARAETLLEHALARAEEIGAAEEGDLVALYLERARVRFAAGSVAGGLHDLGAAFARDSSEAGLELARRALQSGTPERARAVARSVLSAEPGNAAALRLWALAQIAPPALVEPVPPPPAGGTVP